jgi:hypothetical protein
VREGDVAHSTDHYRFFYTPFADDVDESYILLDLYHAKSPYAKTVDVEIKSPILHTEGESLMVTMPDAGCLLGDKLTAFAPTTIGIPLSAEPGKRPKRVEAIKQLYDVSLLFDRTGDIEEIRNTYFAVAAQEIAGRKLGISPRDVLADTLNYVYIIGTQGSFDKEAYDSIAKGYKDFAKFVADLRFDENMAALAAAKAAYIATLILHEGTEILIYDDDTDIGEWRIENPKHQNLNDYLYSNPEAFFYWVMAEKTAQSKR